MRPYSPWYRPVRDAWFVEIGGKQRPLGKHPEGAPKPKKGKNGWNAPPEIMTAFHRLMATESRTLPEADTLRVCQVADLFLDYSQKHHEAATFRGYRDFLQDFCDVYGALFAKDLKPLHVTRWLDSHAGWKGGRRNAVVAVKRAFNWADAEGLLQPNPIKAVKKPAQGRRDRILTPEERTEILAAIKDKPFREFVFAMMETGARPGEVRKVTAANVNLDLGVWVFKEHKTAKRTGKPRIIFLTPAMVDLSRRMVVERPTGPLFTTMHRVRVNGELAARGFSRNGVRRRFRQLRKKLPHLKGVISYTYRATYATNALEQGVGIAQVAELLGHVDTKMVSQHYSMPSQQVKHMREMAKKAASE